MLRYFFECAAQGIARHAPRQRTLTPRGIGLRREIGDQTSQGIQRGLFVVVARIGLKHRVDQIQQPVAPDLQRSRDGKAFAHAAQFAEQAIELTERLHRAAGDPLQRQDVVDQLAGFTDQQARIHPVEAELPGVRRDRRRACLRFHVGVQTPGDARAPQPALQSFAAIGIDSKSPRNRRHVEKIQYFAHQEAALGQIQHA